MKRILSKTLVLRPAKNWRKSLEQRPSKTAVESLASGFEQAERGPVTLWEGGMNGDEPTRHAAELDTLAQTHEALNYCQPLPVEPQEESETVTNGGEWETLDETLAGYLQWKQERQSKEAIAILDKFFSDEVQNETANKYWEKRNRQQDEVTSQAFSGDPDSDLENFLNYLSQHNGEKLTIIVCYDCHKTAIDTPSQMRKNNPFVFVHGWGWHCPSCAMEVGKS